MDTAADAVLNLDDWITAPKVGTRLHLFEVATRLGLSVTDMATAIHWSRGVAHNISARNSWPVRADRAVIRERLRALVAQHGATAEDLAALFFARRRVRGSAKADPKQERETDVLLPKQTLTPLAARHFRLFRNPFDGEVISDEQMFIGDDLRYCREVMRQCATNGGFVAVVGESGAGKTTLQQDLEAWLDREEQSVIVIRPSVLGMEGNDTRGKAIKSADILHAIITRLDSKATVPQTLQARTVKAGRILTASAHAGNKHVLLIEEGHSMPDPTLKHLKRLHEMRAGRQPLLGILLLAQPELKATLAEGLANGSLREVAQRCEVVELLPLDGQLKAYLERRAGAAGVKLAQLMDDEAVEALRTRLTFRAERNGSRRAISMCYPLAVNNLLTKAMNKAAEIGSPLVTKDVLAAI